mgnify:CR=1 FL=1
MNFKADSPPDDFEQRWRERFERFAGLGNDDATIAGWTRTGLAARVRHFERHWPGDAPGRRWLDAGCGAGTYTRLLAARGIDVISMDYSMPTLVKARSRGGAIAWVQADVTRLPVRPASCDGVLCLGVMQALSGSGAALDELLRAVRPQGQVWIDALNAWCLPHLVKSLRAWLHGERPRLRYESPWRMRRFARASGAPDARLVWLPILPARLQRWQWLVEARPVVALLAAVPLLGALLSHSFVIAGTRAGDG